MNTRTDEQIIADLSRPPHPDYAAIKTYLEHARRRHEPRYLLAFALHPADALRAAGLFVAGYAIREYDLYPNTWLSPTGTPLTMPDVLYIYQHKPNHTYHLIDTRPADHILPAPHRAGYLPAPRRRPVWIPVPAMRGTLPEPPGYYPRKIQPGETVL